MTQTLKITSCRGFHIEFPSGWVISVQFGDGNYHENRYKYDYKLVKLNNEHTLSLGDFLSGQSGTPNAEIAVWNTVVGAQIEKENPKANCAGWVRLTEGDTVAGWVGTVAIGLIIGKLAQYPTDAPFEKVTEELCAILGRHDTPDE